MAAKIKWSEEKIAQFQIEGRGKGVGASYKPWVRVSDFSSKGISRRVFSRKSGRHHELLSNVEWHLFLLLEFSREVADIREQFPLLRDETLSIAAKLGIRHPAYPGTRVNAVMSTDFLVKFSRNGSDFLEAFSCKSGPDLEKPRVLEKLEIERSYFNDLGVPHRLVVDSELPSNKVRNIAWLRGAQLDDNEWSEYRKQAAKASCTESKFLRRSCPLQNRWTHAHFKIRNSNADGRTAARSPHRRIQTANRSCLS